MTKIIHLSDLHVGSKNLLTPFSVIVESLTNDMGNEPDQYVIVITGDLVDDANYPENYGNVKSALDQLKCSGFERVLVVPGNHDYGTGSHGNEEFVDLFQQTFLGEKKGYPRKDIINDIAFIGLDSMAEELHWYDELWAEGELGNKQLRALAAVLDGDDVRLCRKRVIYLHHHPFHWRPFHQLKDSTKLRNVLSKAIGRGISVDAILFGHNHQGFAMNGNWGIPRCYDAGTTTLKPRPGHVRRLPWFKVKAATRLIDLEKAPEHDQALSLSR